MHKDSSLGIKSGGSFRKKPVVIEAVTFDELVQHGIGSGVPLTNGMPWSFTYKGHGITHENNDCYLIPTLEGTMRFNRGEMLITGVKGEIYPCRGDIFAATYDPVGTGPKSSGMTFGEAIQALKLGVRVARSGWNGKGMWLSLSGDGVRSITADKFWSKNNSEFAELNGGSAPVLPCITMKTATGEILMGWLASQTDMLAEDWAEV